MQTRFETRRAPVASAPDFLLCDPSALARRQLVPALTAADVHRELANVTAARQRVTDGWQAVGRGIDPDVPTRTQRVAGKLDNLALHGWALVCGLTIGFGGLGTGALLETLHFSQSTCWAAVGIISGAAVALGTSIATAALVSRPIAALQRKRKVTAENVEPLARQVSRAEGVERALLARRVEGWRKLLVDKDAVTPGAREMLDVMALASKDTVPKLTELLDETLDTIDTDFPIAFYKVMILRGLIDALPEGDRAACARVVAGAVLYSGCVIRPEAKPVLDAWLSTT